MTDITKCEGTGCPVKDSCWRFVAKMGDYQSMFSGNPAESLDPFECSHYWKTDRSLSVIAAEIRADWKNVQYSARPYLDAMQSMSRVSDRFGFDTGEGIVLRFLSNASTWRGEVAKRVKTELREMIKQK